MSAVTLTYILGEPNIALGQFIPLNIATIIGVSMPLVGFVIYLFVLFKRRIFPKKETTTSDI